MNQLLFVDTCTIEKMLINEVKLIAGAGLEDYKYHRGAKDWVLSIKLEILSTECLMIFDATFSSIKLIESSLTRIIPI